MNSLFRVFTRSLAISFKRQIILPMLSPTLMMIQLQPITINDAILGINTYQRKKPKLKRSKRKQRRKKIKRMSIAKRERKNY
ncbi:hypothetical protein pb186bvf_016722 [Paramecium bursaria]